MRFILSLIVLLTFATPGWSAAPTLLVFGDSLSAGYGLRLEEAWPSLLAERLREKRLDYNVVNLSVSGETTAGGLARLDAALKNHRPAVLILALGANDGLRGLPLGAMRDNLDAMIVRTQAAGAKILLVGMRLPPNYGPYADQFAASFKAVAEARRIARIDFLLAPIAADRSAFLPDNLHPTAAAQPRLLEHVWPGIEPLLRRPAR